MAGLISTPHMTQVAAAGVGAVAAGFVQASGLVPSTMLGPNLRDALLAVVGVILAGQDGPMVRSFGVGFGAVAVGSLVTRNLFAAIVPSP